MVPLAEDNEDRRDEKRNREVLDDGGRGHEYEPGCEGERGDVEIGVGGLGQALRDVERVQHVREHPSKCGCDEQGKQRSRARIVPSGSSNGEVSHPAGVGKVNVDEEGEKPCCDGEGDNMDHCSGLND